MAKLFGEHHRNLLLFLLCFFVSVEIAGVSFLTGCSRRVGSSQVLFQRKIRKDVLAEKAKAEVNASDLPPEIKSEVNQRIDQVPVADSDREQISAILNELVKALKDGKATPAQLTKIAASAVDELSELNTDDPSNGLLPMLQRPEIAEAIEILKREGLPEEEILKAALHQADPTLVTNPQATAEVLQDPLFSNFSQGSKTAVLAASGDPNAQRHSQFASAVTEAINDQGLPLAVSAALQLSVVNVPPADTAQADAEAILVALNGAARNQSLETAARAELLLDAVDAILGATSSFTTAEAEQLFKKAFGILTESGVSGAAVVSASIARLPAERRDSATEIDALLASSLYDSFSPEVRAEAKDVLYKQYVPAPTDITLSSSILDENAGANGVVGTLSTAHVDAVNTFTYTLVAGSGGTDNASFNISTNSLRLTASADFETKSSYSVRIRSTDNGTLFFEKAFTITINDVNEAPTDITLSSSSLNENAGANGVVGTLSTADVDAGSTFTYSLVAGTGSTDNAAFNISTNSLRLTANADFETKSSYSVRIRSTDNGSLLFEKAFTITINDVNEAPSDITLSSSSLNENGGANGVVGGLFSTDSDAGNTFTYTLVAGIGSTDNAAFNISTNSLRLTASADFETKSSYSVRIRSTDNGTLFFEKAFTITINDVNETPTDITLSSIILNENAGANGVVGTLSTSDVDAGNTFTYTLVAGSGSTDNAAFNISGSSLRLTASADFETKSSYSVRIRSTDNGTLFFEKAFTITINNMNEAPTAILLNDQLVAEGMGPLAEVGVLSTQDPDAGESFSYTLVTGAGDTDNAAFSISGDRLLLNASADFDMQNSYSVRVQSRDQGGTGLTRTESFTINVVFAGWRQEAYIKAANAEAYDLFGYSVSLSGDTLAVGAIWESENSTVILNGTTAPNANGATDSGAVYVYRRTGVTWTPEAYFKAANAEAGDEFGTSVSLSGNSLAVGVPNEDENSTVIVNGTTAPKLNGATNSGAVYVYRRTGTMWAPEAYVKATNGEEYDKYGWSVSLSGDTLAVGAYQEEGNGSVIVNGASVPNLNGANASGAVYVYRRTGGTWVPEAYIKAANVEEFDEFGTSVSLSGETLAVGSRYESENSTVIVNGTTAPNANGAYGSGAVYVYRRTGGSWAPEAYIKAANAEASDDFGTSLSLSGETLAVGARWEDENSSVIVNGTTAPNANGAYDSGAVYVYRRTGVTWAPEAYIKAANAEEDDGFGWSVSLSGDTLAVGAYREGENSTTIVNGTAAPNANGAIESGAVYVYRRTGVSWTPEAYIKAANAASIEEFGWPVSLSGDTLAVGAAYEDENSTIIINGTTAPNLNGATDSGAVYVYRSGARAFEPVPALSVVSQSATSLLLEWSANLGSAQEVKVVQSNGNTAPANCSSGTMVYEGLARSHLVTGLTAETQYSFRLCAVTKANGSTTYSAGSVISGWTPDTTAPVIQSIVRVGSGTNTSSETEFIVTFSEPPYFDSSSFIVTDVYSSGLEIEGLRSRCLGKVCQVFVSAYGSGSIRLDLPAGSVSDLYGNVQTGSYTSGGIVTIDATRYWQAEAYIKAANADAGNEFGWSVSQSGDTLAVGAVYENENSTTIVNGTTAPNADGAANSGAVYVYRRTGVTWAPEAYIKAANAGLGDYFGWPVSLSGDTLAVGAIGEDENSSVIVNGTTAPNANGATDSGAVYVYRRTGVTWAQEAYIKAANASASDQFGWSVSLSGDTLAVAAPTEDEFSFVIINGTTAPNLNGRTDSGAVYVYRRTGVNWAQEAYVKAANAQSSDRFGNSVSLSGDTLAVGTRFEGENSSVIVNGTTAPNANGAAWSGAVYVYRRTGVSWAREAYIKAANVSSNDLFGTSVSLSGDTLAVGADSEDENSSVIVNGTTAPNANGAADSGAVYVYRRTGVNWAPEAYIKAANAEVKDLFGTAVGLSGDTLAVGVKDEGENSSVIVNGSNAPNANGAPNSGAVYVYRRTGVNWAPEAYIKAANAEVNDLFGFTVSLSGDTLAVGASDEDENSSVIVNGTTAPNGNGSPESGAVYVYRNSIRLADPDVRVSATAPTSISFAWGSNLGPTGAQIIVAPAATGTATPAACQLAGGGGSLTLAAGVTTYTYSGLTAGTTYGFRFCSTDGTNISGGTTLWFDTAP